MQISPCHFWQNTLKPLASTSTLLLLLLSQIGIAQQATEQTKESRLNQIKQIELENLNNGIATQTQVEDLDEKRMLLAAEFRTVTKQNTNIKKYNSMLRDTLVSKQEEIESLKNQISRIANLERDIVPLMSDMLVTLDNFIALDIPFLHEERTKRIKNLKALMKDGNISNAEKYRRLLEAYQIENDYGRTIETYKAKLISPEGEHSDQTVNYMKVGRIAFMYQTLDKQESYHWSADSRQWQRLDDSYNASIDEGIKMANEQIPSNLLIVPVEIPEETSTLSMHK